MFDINYKKIFKRLVPHFLRKATFLDYINSVANVIKQTNTSLVDLRTRIQDKLAFNSQVIYMEKLLNDSFDVVLQRIFIENTSVINFLYIHRNTEVQPPQVFLRRNTEGGDPVFIKRIEEIEALDDFIVHVPAAITFDENELRALVDTYRLAGKQYSINIF